MIFMILKGLEVIESQFLLYKFETIIVISNIENLQKQVTDYVLILKEGKVKGLFKK